MFKKTSFLILSMALSLGLSACKDNQVTTPTQQTNQKEQQIITHKAQDNEVKQIQQDLLKNNENYSKANQKQSLEVNFKSNDEKPLYVNPKFAVVTIFPYVSDEGIYHEYERVWIKIKDGEFALEQKSTKKAMKNNVKK